MTKIKNHKLEPATNPQYWLRCMLACKKDWACRSWSVHRVPNTVNFRCTFFARALEQKFLIPAKPEDVEASRIGWMGCTNYTQPMWKPCERYLCSLSPLELVPVVLTFRCIVWQKISRIFCAKFRNIFTKKFLQKTFLTTFCSEELPLHYGVHTIQPPET